MTSKSQFSKARSPYTFKYPWFWATIFLIGAVIIIAIIVAAYYLRDDSVQLELQIFIFSFYSIFEFAVIWHLLKTLNFKLVLAEQVNSLLMNIVVLFLIL